MNTLSDRELNELAFRFFKMFARMEYALKAAGFHKGTNNKAEPNWDRFAKSVKKLFEKDHEGELGEAVHFILDAPPKVQMINAAEQLEWADKRESGNRARQLLVYIRRVRNNLFHGGKFNGIWFAPERSEPLMRHSLTVLHACLEESTTVRDAYNS